MGYSNLALQAKGHRCDRLEMCVGMQRTDLALCKGSLLGFCNKKVFTQATAEK